MSIRTFYRTCCCAIMGPFLEVIFYRFHSPHSKWQSQNSLNCSKMSVFLCLLWWYNYAKDWESIIHVLTQTVLKQSCNAFLFRIVWKKYFNAIIAGHNLLIFISKFPFLVWFQNDLERSIGHSCYLGNQKQCKVYQDP